MTQVGTRNLLILGDLAVPPRSLLAAFREGTCSRELVSDIPRFDGEAVRVVVNNKHVDLSLWDEQPDAEYIGPRRRLSSAKVHIILISFAIDFPDSLESWIEQALSLHPRVPILLVGCNKEFRNDPALKEYLKSMMQAPVTSKQGEEVARNIDATKYMECSQWTGEGVGEVLEAAAQASLATRRHKRKQQCDVM